MGRRRVRVLWLPKLRSTAWVQAWAYYSQSATSRVSQALLESYLQHFWFSSPTHLSSLGPLGCTSSRAFQPLTKDWSLGSQSDASPTDWNQTQSHVRWLQVEDKLTEDCNSVSYIALMVQWFVGWLMVAWWLGKDSNMIVVGSRWLRMVD